MSFSNINQKRDSQTLRTTRYKDYEDNKHKSLNYNNLTFDFGSNYDKNDFKTDNPNQKQNLNNTCGSKSRNISRERTKEFSPNKPTNKSRSRSKEQIKSNTNSNSKSTYNSAINKSFEEENDSNYKGLLEKKIKSQAERLYELQKYKDILEKRILRFNPNEVFPVTESKSELDYLVTPHFNESTKFDPVQQLSNVNYSFNKIKNSKSLENEIAFGSKNIKDALASLQKENDFLKLKIANLEKEKEVLRNSNLEANKIDIDGEMLNLDRIPNESLREAYINLQNYCEKIKNEKESVMHSLNQEVLLSEEQRNYIEILKKILENSIINNDLKDLLQQQKNFLLPQNKSMIEFICDISHLQKELEKKLKEAIELNSTIDQLEKETQFLKQINLEYDLKREMIIESLKIGMSELEETKVYVKKLESERNSLSAELSLIKPENEELKNLKKINFEKINEFERVLSEKENVITDLNKLIDQQTLLENKLLEYKEKFQIQHQEFERVLQEKDSLDKLSFMAQERSKQLEFSLKEKALILKETEEKLAVYKNLFEDEKKKIISIQNNLKEKEFELTKEINTLNVLLDENSRKFDKKNLESSDLDRKLIKELKENEKLNEDLIKFKNEIALLNIENAKLHDKVAETGKREKSLLDKIQILNKDYFEVKQKYDMACFDLEDAQKNYLEYEKEIEIFNSEKNQFLHLFEKEKKDVQLKESLIKALENEIHQKSALISNFNKISNLSFVNLKASFKNILNSFDSYNVKLSGIKNKILFLNDAEESNEEEALDKNVFKRKEFFEHKNNFDNQNFNFRKYVGKDKETLNSNLDRKRNERNFNLNGIYNNPNKNYVGAGNKKKNELKSYVKELTYSIESFGEWIEIIKEEINSNLNIIHEFEKLAMKNKIDPPSRDLNIRYTKDFTKDPNNESNTEINEESKKIFKHDYSILQEEIKQLKNLNSEYRAKNEKLIKDLKSFRNDNKKLYDHNKQINQNFNNKFSLQEKEILYLKNLVLKTKSFVTNDNIRKYIDQILEANTFISEYEIERLKLEKNFEKYESELKAFIDKENNSLENSELYSELKLKVSNARNKVCEINKKIQDSKQEILVLENEINKEKDKDKDKDRVVFSLDRNSSVNNVDEVDKKDILKNPLVEKFKKMQKENLILNEISSRKNPKENLILNNKVEKENFRIKETREQPIESDEDLKITQINKDIKNLEKENSIELDNQEENENNYCKYIENNTVNEFFNNNKATNVFKKNYVDSNKNADIERNNRINEKHSNDSYEKEVKKLYENKIDKLNFEYKLNPEINQKELIENNADHLSKAEESNISAEEEEYNEEHFEDNRNKQKFNSKKLEGISIDTDKINEKYEKFLNRNSKEVNKDANKAEINSLLKDGNLEYKIKDGHLRPFSEIKSERTSLNNKDNNVHKASEVPKALETKRNQHNLNFNYELDVEGLENKMTNEDKSNLSDKNDYNFEYKRSLNSERNKRDNKRTFKNILTEDIDKFCKSPEKLNSKNTETTQVKNDMLENPISNHTKDNYSCNNNFTFNNEETENSIESKMSKKLNKISNEDLTKESRRDTDAGLKCLQNESLNPNNLPKRRGFGKRNFDIDI